LVSFTIVGKVYLKRNLNRPKENGDACTGETGRQGGRENGAGDENEEDRGKRLDARRIRGGDGEMERKKRERW
jgi:hypothetical protein